MRIILFAVLLAFEVSGFPMLFAAGKAVHGSALPDLLRKKDVISMLVIDSGLGGLSVCADIEARTKTGSPYKEVNVIFCNALPEAGYGYNDMGSMEEKAEVFSRALQGMAGRYKPDVILIACNTLSVVYPHTEFSRSTNLPVLEIISIAAEMITQRLQAQPDAVALIFGTETTISSDAHRTQLLALGIDGRRILSQACPKLETEIQVDPQSDIVHSYTEMYVDEAVQKMPGKNAPVIAALCCTHYGYALEAFEKGFQAAGIQHVELLNPNDRMAALCFQEDARKRFSKPRVTVRVLSRVQFSLEEIQAIAGVLETKAPRTARALHGYSQDSRLFPFEKKLK
jgi:glutamate racemase